MSSELQVGYRTVDGLQIRYADSDGPASQHLVLTSPWPESLHAFDRVWSRLSGIARLLAVDLPGFGRSERRTDLLSPMAMSEFLIRILDEWDLSDPHLICPGVGTPAALFAAARQPGRIRSLVVGGAATAYPLQVDGALKELIDAPDIGAFRSQDPRALIQGLLAPLGAAAPAEDIVADYVESNRGGRFAEATRYVRSYPEQLPVLRDLLPTIRVPVHVFAAADDPLVPVSNGEYLAERIPGSKLTILPASHFAWEEVPDQFAALVTDWVTRAEARTVRSM